MSDFFSKSLESDELRLKADLRRRINSLKFDLEQELERIDSRDDYNPNSMGVVQQSGSVIDLICAELHTVKRLRETHDSITRVYGGKDNE